MGPVRAIGKEKEDFPFCPASKNTLTQIKEITAILKGNTRIKKLDCKRTRRSASSCDFVSWILFFFVNLQQQRFVMYFLLINSGNKQ